MPAFNVNIPGPKLIDLDLFGKLGQLGEAFRENREEAFARDIFANMQSDDPASVDEAIRKLGHLPKYAGIAQKMAESRQQAANRAATLEIQRGQLAETQARTGIAKEQWQEQRQELERQRKSDERFEQKWRERPALPPAEDEAATIGSATGIRPSSESQPTTFTPGNRAVQERFPDAGDADWWDFRARPPGPQSNLQDQMLGGGASTDVLVGQATGATPIRPMAPAPEGSRLRPASLRERALDAEVKHYEDLLVDAPPSRVRAIETRIKALDTERRDLRKRREDSLAAQEKAQLQQETRAAAIEEEPKKELGKKLVAETRSLAEQEPILREIGAIARTPGYSGGSVGRLNAVDAAVLPQIVPESIRPGFVQGAIDKGTLVRRIDTLNKSLTRAEAGEKGVGTQGFTDKDRDFIGSIQPSVDDPQQVLQLKAEAGLAVTERRQEIVKIIETGLKEGRTVAEINAGVAAYGKKYPLFITQDGKLTELGRKVNPALARSMGGGEDVSASKSRGAATQGFTGRTATNKETGEKLRETTDGKWVP